MCSGLKVNDLRLDDENPSIRLIYDGSISLWRASKNLDVLIVDHAGFSCYELIAFDPFGNNHPFPSIFVDSALLRSKVSQELVNRSLQEEVERLNRQNRVCDEEQFLKQTMETFHINILLSRLAMTKVDQLPGGVYLQPQLVDCLFDKDTGDIFVSGTAPNGVKLDIVIDKPPSLIPTETIIVPPLRNSGFARCLNSFNGQTSAVAHKVHVAAILLQVSNHYVAQMHRHAYLSTLSRPRQRF